MTFSDCSEIRDKSDEESHKIFESPVYDFGSDISSTTPRRKAKVGFEDDVLLLNHRCRVKRRPKSACSLQDQLAKKERLNTLIKGKSKQHQRSSSALGLRRHEPHPSRCDSRNTDSELSSGHHKHLCIRNFRRSLKLLGLEPEHFGLVTDKPRYIPDTKNAKARVNTFVSRRTVSLNDLREAVVKEGFHLDYDDYDPESERKNRQILAKAVYEEWYFKKQAESQKRRDEYRREMKVQQWELQHMKCERLRKSQESVAEWLQKKKRQLREEREKKYKDLSRPKPVNYRSERAGSAYESWKKEKDKLLQLKLEEEKRQLRLLEQRAERRAEAERVYEGWKIKADDMIKLKINEAHKKQKEAIDEENRKKMEKTKLAESSYRYWKERKDNEIRERIREERELQEKLRKLRKERISQRLYEANQAFLEWLDAAEERYRNDISRRRTETQPPQKVCSRAGRVT